ncbi:unnamed protein product [Amoebophrya sp. A120]|nr:unnamed protein product [Amoebophrya sp. A120]|eukprot:GSA120T00007830001.1
MSGAGLNFHNGTSLSSSSHLDIARRSLEEFERANLISLAGQELLDHLRSQTKHAKQVPKHLRQMYFPSYEVFTERSSITEFSKNRVLRLKQVKADVTEEDLYCGICKVLVAEIRDQQKKFDLQQQCPYMAERLTNMGGGKKKKKNHAFSSSGSEDNESGGEGGRNLTEEEREARNERKKADNWFQVRVGKMTKEECQFAVEGGNSNKPQLKEVVTVHISIREEKIDELLPLLNHGFERWDRSYDKILSPAKSWKLKADWGSYIVVDEMHAAKLASAAETLKQFQAKKATKRLLAGLADSPGDATTAVPTPEDHNLRTSNTSSGGPTSDHDRRGGRRRRTSDELIDNEEGRRDSIGALTAHSNEHSLAGRGSRSASMNIGVHGGMMGNAILNVEGQHRHQNPSSASNSPDLEDEDNGSFHSSLDDDGQEGAGCSDENDENSDQDSNAERGSDSESESSSDVDSSSDEEE